MNINPDRAVVGVACTFGEASTNDGWIFRPEQFAPWLALEMGLPMRVDHGSLIDHHGAILHVGRWASFAIIKSPVHGLLALGEIADDDATRGYGSSLLYDLRQLSSLRWLPSDWALSIAAHTSDEAVLPYEISLTRTPACPDAQLLGVGREALERWELLTEARVKSA